MPRDSAVGELIPLPLTDFGRRVLMRHAMLSPDGRVGVPELARQLGVTDVTVWRLLKTTEPGWWTQPRNTELAARLCALLKVDRSWLYDVIDYGDMGRLDFSLRKRQMWRLPRVRNTTPL